MFSRLMGMMMMMMMMTRLSFIKTVSRTVKSEELTPHPSSTIQKPGDPGRATLFIWVVSSTVLSELTSDITVTLDESK